MKKTKIAAKPWDAADHLKTRKDMAAYLEVVIAAAIGDIARARGMSEIARKTGLGRESLYKALSPGRNPEFAKIFKVVQALGLQLRLLGICFENLCQESLTLMPAFCLTIL